MTPVEGASAWNPAQYERFADERSQPFYDLLALVEPRPSMRVVDLGCGTGALTRVLHDRLGAAETLGLDTSETMLAESEQHAGGGLRFERGDIATFAAEEPFDLVFSNAAVHWVPDHEALFPRLAELVDPESGQLAVQMPTNHDHLSHRVAADVAAEEPFRSALDGYMRQVPVLAVEEYALLLDRLGFGSQHTRVQVYLHHLSGPESVVEWVKGTLLTDYRQRLPDDLYQAYLARYRERLLPLLPDERPYRYPFKRVLLWSRR